MSEEQKTDIYTIFNGIKNNGGLDYFKKVKGVTNVEYDHIYRLTDPVKPKLELK